MELTQNSEIVFGYARLCGLYTSSIKFTLPINFVIERQLCNRVHCRVVETNSLEALYQDVLTWKGQYSISYDQEEYWLTQAPIIDNSFVFILAGRRKNPKWWMRFLRKDSDYLI